jgi:SAM-dependent methyltransferase
MRTDVDPRYVLDLNRRFHDDVEAATYDQRMGVIHDADAIERTVAELEHVLGAPLPRSGKVVDVASGTGNIAVKLALTGWYDEVIAVDISTRSLDVAKNVARSLGKDLTIVESDMVTLPFASNSVDFIVGCAFLHHLPDPVAFMSEVNRVLKPGAAFVIIGEPTHFGMNAINIVKFPLVLANRVQEGMKGPGKSMFRWDHDNIDVHDFSQGDARRLLNGFTEARIVTQGFAEPIIDQGILAPVRLVLGDAAWVNRTMNAFRRMLAAMDRFVFNRVLPHGMKVSLKISGKKPVFA